MHPWTSRNSSLLLLKSYLRISSQSKVVNDYKEMGQSVAKRDRSQRGRLQSRRKVGQDETDIGTSLSVRPRGRAQSESGQIHAPRFGKLGHSLRPSCSPDFERHSFPYMSRQGSSDLGKPPSGGKGIWTKETAGYCSFLLLRNPEEAERHAAQLAASGEERRRVERKTKRKLAATKEYINQNRRELWVYLYHRELRCVKKGRRDGGVEEGEKIGAMQAWNEEMRVRSMMSR